MQLSRNFRNGFLTSPGVWAGIVVSVLLYVATDRVVETNAEDQFEHQAVNVQLAIRARVQSYVDMLRGASALFQTGEPVLRSQFKNFVASLKLDESYPGVKNINYAIAISDTQKNAFISKIRDDASFNAPGFKIEPPGTRPYYHVLTYLEPVDALSSFGKDLAANPMVKTALDEARDTGKPMSSGRLIPVPGKTHVDIAMRMPLYQPGVPLATLEQRRAAYLGSVGGAFDVEKLMQGVFDDEALKHMRFRLYDIGKSDAKHLDKAGTQNLLFDSRPEPKFSLRGDESLSSGAYFITRFPMEVGSHTWQVEYIVEKTTLLRQFDPSLPWIALCIGLFATSLLYSVYYSLKSAHRRAEELATEMTVELRQSEASLADAQHMAHLGNWLLDLTNETMIWSLETYRILGREPQDGLMRYQDFLDQIHDEDRQAVRDGLNRTAATGEEFSSEHRMKFVSGDSERWVHTIVRIGQDEKKSMLRGTIMDITDRKSAENVLRHIANHDALTDLPNRSMFNECLRHALNRSNRNHADVAVLFIDLDRFKIVNDTFGHTAGDRLLQDCASLLVSVLRRSDIVARLGGDEFAVIVEQAGGLAGISAVAKKVLSAFEKPFIVDGHEFTVGASIGISTYPEDGTDVEELLKNADTAMYRAKIEGNSYQFYSAKMNQDSMARFAMESHLRHAIERQEFLLYFQPKLDMQTGRIIGVEALLRWQHPDWGLVSPAQFIPLAEESGLIIEIGRWVLRVACEQCVKWQRRGHTGMRVAVNLSARQFKHKDLLSDISDALAETGIDADCLELEITESMVMENADEAISVLGKIKTMGVHLSIDDFGTGYSSLAYLRRLPVDCVKIDRAFVKDIPTEVDDMIISKSIIRLGHSLRLKVVAEGVETAEQFNFLKEEGCDEIQGYLISRPLPASELTALLEQ